MKDLKKLLSQMTLDEKIAQLCQYNGNLFADSETEITGPMMELGLTKEDLSRVGSVLNCFDVETACNIQREHLAQDRNQIPLLFMLDVIHGFRTIFPIPLALGCSFDTDLVEQCSQIAAKETVAGGIHATFTPMVDYVRDARWGRVMESCSEEPLLNGRMGAAQVRAFQGDDMSGPNNIAACVKHFAGYGAAEAGRDYNTTELSVHVLREYYLPAYKACIDAGVAMLMPAFNSLNGRPATANRWLMNDLLRKQWGFDGIVISDYAAISDLMVHGVAENAKDAAKQAFDCGCHIEMCSSTYIHHLKELIAEGAVSQTQVDDAVMRVLELKNKLGLFEDPYRGASKQRYEAVCAEPENRALARKAAAESAVLLKNDGILPFDDTVKSVALIGPMAQEHDIIGFWSCNGKSSESVTVYEGVAAALPHARITCVRGCGNQWNDIDTSGFAEAVAAAESADIVVLCLGEPQDYSGEGNCRTDISLPGLQEQLAEMVIKANPNTAVLLFNGRPLAIPKLARIAPAILDMWFPGTEGGNAAADLLFGKANPCGKLSMSFPKATGQCPIYYNHPNATHVKLPKDEDVRRRYCSNYIDCGNLPLYSFGHGMSYSNFVYKGLELSSDSMTADSNIIATVTVQNQSDRPGKETVQLYMRDLVASTIRPVQQLIDFQKLDFQPGETKEVSFTITEPMLRLWNDRDQFASEAGKFQISTGCADHLIHTREFVLRKG